MGEKHRIAENVQECDANAVPNGFLARTIQTKKANHNS